MPILSEDLLHELLSLLPSIVLLRFRCVSKSWRALIDSQYFIQLHLNKSLKDIKSRKVLAVAHCLDSHYLRMKFYATGFDSEFKFTVPREIKSPIKGSYKLGYTGSCRSLICLEFTGLGSKNDNIVLWNPSTRTHRILPFTPVEIASATTYNRYYAFGYDEVEDDYKLVRLTFVDNNYDYEVKVYSLKLDSWKEIEKIPLPVSNIISARILSNGTLTCVLKEKNPYFQGWGDTACLLLILPLETEVLQLVPRPKGLDKFDYEFMKSSFSSCDFRDCDHRFRNALKLINYEKSDTLSRLLFLINGGMTYLNDSLRQLCSKLEPFSDEEGRIFFEDAACWVESFSSGKKQQ